MERRRPRLHYGSQASCLHDEPPNDRISNMGPLGFQEVLLILIIALVIFGPKKLPELGRSLGKTLAEFRRASNEIKNSIEKEIEETEHK